MSARKPAEVDDVLVEAQDGDIVLIEMTGPWWTSDFQLPFAVAKRLADTINGCLRDEGYQ